MLRVTNSVSSHGSCDHVAVSSVRYVLDHPLKVQFVTGVPSIWIIVGIALVFMLSLKITVILDWGLTEKEPGNGDTALTEGGVSSITENDM